MNELEKIDKKIKELEKIKQNILKLDNDNNNTLLIEQWNSLQSLCSVSQSIEYTPFGLIIQYRLVDEYGDFNVSISEISLTSKITSKYKSNIEAFINQFIDYDYVNCEHFADWLECQDEIKLLRKKYDDLITHIGRLEEALDDEDFEDLTNRLINY